MRTKYRIDDYQQNYFVIDSFDDLLRQTLDTDFAPIYQRLARQPDIEIDTILSGDLVYSQGTHNRARARLAQE